MLLISSILLAVIEGSAGPTAPPAVPPPQPAVAAPAQDTPGGTPAAWTISAKMMPSSGAI